MSSRSRSNSRGRSMSRSQSRSRSPRDHRIRSHRNSFRDAPYRRETHRGFSQSNLCNNCKRPGHFARECPNVSVCNNCGLPGHIASECTTLSRCWNCREPGHVASNCPNEGICHSCGQSGHRARDCPNPDMPSGDLRLCNNCYKPGHIAAECTNDKACKNCRKTGHIARDCQNEPVCNLCNIAGHVARQCPKGNSHVERAGWGRNNGYRDVVCRTCNQVGHMSRDCVGPMIICHNCGGRGHRAFECPSGRFADRGFRRNTLRLPSLLWRFITLKCTKRDLRISFGDKISVSDNIQLWIHENSGLLLPVLRSSLEWDQGNCRFFFPSETPYRSEESDGTSSERTEKEAALRNTIGAAALGLESPNVFSQETERTQITQTGISNKAMEERILLTYQRTVTVLYELLSACIMDIAEGDNKSFQPKKGYDARH